MKKIIKLWWLNFTQWQSLDSWTKRCRYCEYLDHGYSYGIPDTAIYFDANHKCLKKEELEEKIKNG